MTKVAIDSTTLSDIAINGLQETKGKEIVRMDLRENESAVTNYFVICTGTSDRHVQALAEKVMEQVAEEAEEKPISKEGLHRGEWVLLDYVDVVVHIFQETTRNFYRLESLWGDAPSEHIESIE